MDVPRFFEALGTGVDFVSGSRYRPDSHVTSSAPEDRQHINHVITEKIDEATGYDITDAFCGLKAYHLSIFDRIQLTEPGYAVCVEFWAKAWKAGLTMVELPVERIYVDLHRTFGPELDDPDRRLALLPRRMGSSHRGPGGLTMVRVRPGTPSGHGEMLVEPPPAEWPALVERTAASRAAWSFEVAGVPAPEFARRRPVASWSRTRREFSARLGVPAERRVADRATRSPSPVTSPSSTTPASG